MHFTGRTWRPFYEKHSVILQATSGCTWQKCRFCNLYSHEPFRLSPIEEFESDLQEIKQAQPYARRLFLTGGNPFAMSYENLRLRALLVRDYLIKCQHIAMFASIRDIMDKSVAQLRRLRALGVNGLSIGTESGDNKTLALANKGYTVSDIVTQCHKLDEAGIEYYFVYMTGLCGAGNGLRCAQNSAATFNQVNPRFISVDSLTLFPDTPLHTLAENNVFHPASEHERIAELQTLVKRLELRTHLFANSSTNFLPFTAFLPKEREYALQTLQYQLDTFSEAEMAAYRQTLKTL